MTIMPGRGCCLAKKRGLLVAGVVWHRRDVQVPTPSSAADFVRAHTRLQPAPYLCQLQLHLADEAIELWEKTEAELGEVGLPPPFWAFAWAGGLGLARYVLDNPELVRGQRVFDLASGCGLVAIAAARAGAEAVAASEIDPFAAAAIALNAQANRVAVDVRLGDVLDEHPGPGATVVFAGDVFYSKPMTDRVLPFLRRARSRGASVLVGDPGRAYLPGTGFEELATFDVPVTRALEDADTKLTRVLRLTG
jgi:predicted nicotinamide N-methyase